MEHHFQYLTLVICILVSCEGIHEFEINLEDSPTETTLFGEGVISTPLYERDMAISTDGKEIIYTLGNYKQTTRALVSLKKLKGEWGVKTILEFSGKHNDIEPFFSSDGNQLFFASDRPIFGDSTRNDYNIWVVDRIGSGWSTPEPLSTSINTDGDEFFPAVSNKGNLYFTATREKGIGREDIYKSEIRGGIFQESVPLDTNINSVLFEFNAYISPNEDLIIFSSFGRDDGFGGGDLYISEKDENGNWKKAINMGKRVNSSALDYCPYLDLQNNNFYFTSEYIEPIRDTIRSVTDLERLSNDVMNGMGNIYKISWGQLKNDLRLH